MHDIKHYELHESSAKNYDQLFEWIINHDEVTLLLSQFFVFKNKKGLGIDVESINYDINFRDIPTITCKDFVFDDVTFKDCVVN